MIRGIQVTSVTDSKGANLYLPSTGTPLPIVTTDSAAVFEFSHWGENLGLAAPRADQVVDGTQLSQ